MSFVVGIFFGSDGIAFPFDIFCIIIPTTLCLLIGIRAIIPIALIISMSICWYLLSLWEYDTRIQDIRATQSILEKKYSIIGTVEKKLYKTELNQAYRLFIDNFDNISPSPVDIDTISPKILIEIPENLTLNRGDSIVFTWKIISLYQWELVDFAKYTFFHELSWKSSLSDFVRTSHREIWVFERISLWTEQHIFRGFPRDAAGIILGMTIGNVELMSRAVQEDFRTSGISHILVVSGSNITFLIILIGGILKYFPIQKNIRVIIICSFVLLYSTLVWWDVPVLRSTIMWLLGYYAIEQGSKLSSIALLFLVGSIFLIYSPLSLVYDPAFGLSFTATMSIILYYSPLYEACKKYKIPSTIASIISLSISASVWTIPITLYYFWTISPWVVFSNIAIASVVGVILFLSVWYILLGFLGSGFLYIFWFLIYIPIRYIMWIADVFWRFWTIEPSDDIKNILILIFLAFFCFEVLKDETILRQKAQKKHDLR
jgi:ComEC/Rec2-related protein